MQKISGILPSSNRIAKVDLKEAPPLRPSAPDFSKSFFEPALTWKAKDIAKAAIADEVSGDFFKNYNAKMEVGVPSPELRPGVAPLAPEPVPVFTPSQPLPMDGPLMAYAEQIYGEPEPQQGGAEESGQNLDVYA